ncbi:MAG: glycoside hydrolase family 15 protein [Alphaproteobacteria bacterium]|nr:glycoside hydrolase family 15 protein [Alphaproteobacteria bacterium]MBV9694422.1 glycoside hydrolase family 15 protein [Alphaproteobacteria bacterium]
MANTRHPPLDIADYGLIGDCRSAALVGRNGSIDWLCWPRFDSDACFAALLGDARHGCWVIRPAKEQWRSTRRYIGDTLVLETVFESVDGSFALIDFMAIDSPTPSLVRVLEGRSGKVRIRMDLTLRFDYGSSVPWVTRLAEGFGIVAIAGPNLTVLRSEVALHGEDLSTVAEFDLAAHECKTFVLSYGASHLSPPEPLGARKALAACETFWQQWAARCTYKGDRRDAVVRSLLTLKALTYSQTGGIVAAPTTSLPERLGGNRNWDYRYCWIRDATLTLTALMGAGYYEEAAAWRDWLHRSLAGTPDALQIMYGLAGERRLTEWEVPWLPGYGGAKPVRIGNAASSQRQLDVWGEMADALRMARKEGLTPELSAWGLQCAAIRHLEKIWREPDNGIWEMRGPRRHFVYSKIMAWVAFDRSIRDAEKYGFKGPLSRWREIRDSIHRAVCEDGFDVKRNTFTQSFGSRELDASLLLIPQTGFLPAQDPRVAGTVASIERELLQDGFVRRYNTSSGADGLPSGEGVFLACSFWLADVYQRRGRLDAARDLVDRLLALRNDLGLFSEEYDPAGKKLTGNFPQGFPHLALVQTAVGLDERVPLRDRLGINGST